MKPFVARIAVLTLLAAVVGLAPTGRPLASAQEPKKEDPPAVQKEKIMVWVGFSPADCAETEMTVNGKSLGKFQSTTQKDISDLIKAGQNTIVFTTPQEPATSK